MFLLPYGTIVLPHWTKAIHKIELLIFLAESCWYYWTLSPSLSLFNVTSSTPWCGQTMSVLPFKFILFPTSIIFSHSSILTSKSYFVLFHHFIVPHSNFILCFIHSGVTLCSPAKSQISFLQTEALQKLFTAIWWGMLSVPRYRTATNKTPRSVNRCQVF